MDRASSGKLILLCFKQNQTALFDVQHLADSEVIAITHSEVIAIARSELDATFRSSSARNTQSRSARNDDFLQLGTVIFMARNPHPGSLSLSQRPMTEHRVLMV
jgi:hypothetical protein